MDRPERPADRGRRLQLRSHIDWTGWNREVLAYLKDHAEYLSLHTYVGNAAGDYYDFLAVSNQLDDRIKTAAGIIRAATGGQRHGKPILYRLRRVERLVPCPR